MSLNPVITSEAPTLSKGASFLIAYQLQHKNVLIVGAGNVAFSRITRAVESEAIVTVIAPSAHDHVKSFSERGEINWIAREYKDSDISEFKPDMVLVGINNMTVSTMIAKECRMKNIPVNVADVPDMCDFFFMSEHRDGPLQIGVSTNGHGPALAIRVRKNIQASLPKDCGQAIEKIGNLRKKLRNVDNDPNNANKRMPWMSYICKNWPIEHLAQLSDSQMQKLVTNYQADNSYLPKVNDFAPRGGKGKIVMVGAGLGDPELLTIKAHRALTEADVVISDRLISDEILSLVKCELKVARKVPGSASSAQDEINDWGLKALEEGKYVVRLKSGDPFLYGRAGEEIIWYRKHGYEPSVVPGISSALCPSIAKIPITHRTVSNQVLIISAHNFKGAYPEIPEYYPQRTIVMLMGVGRLDKIVNMMLEKNYPPSLDVVIIENASHIEERQVFGTLKSIHKIAENNNVESPATIVFGNAVNCLNL